LDPRGTLPREVLTSDNVLDSTMWAQPVEELCVHSPTLLPLSLVVDTMHEDYTCQREAHWMMPFGTVTLIHESLGWHGGSIDSPMVGRINEKIRSTLKLLSPLLGVGIEAECGYFRRTLLPSQ
jgi:hypothetical protein